MSTNISEITIEPWNQDKNQEVSHEESMDSFPYLNVRTHWYWYKDIHEIFKSHPNGADSAFWRGTSWNAEKCWIAQLAAGLHQHTPHWAAQDWSNAFIIEYAHFNGLWKETLPACPCGCLQWFWWVTQGTWISLAGTWVIWSLSPSLSVFL